MNKKLILCNDKKNIHQVNMVAYILGVDHSLFCCILAKITCLINGITFSFDGNHIVDLMFFIFVYIFHTFFFLIKLSTTWTNKLVKNNGTSRALRSHVSDILILEICWYPVSLLVCLFVLQGFLMVQRALLVQPKIQMVFVV